MKNTRASRLIATALPLLIFYAAYRVYLYLFYCYTENVPLGNKNYGYVLLLVLVVTRLFNFINLSEHQNYHALLSWRSIGYNMPILVVGWLVVGNIIALMEMFAPFRENMIAHILLLFFLSLLSAREILFDHKLIDDN